MVWNEKLKEGIYRNIFILLVLGIIVISLIGTVSAENVSAPTVTKTASPTDINLAGSGVAPEETNVAITVTGAGSTSTSAIPMDVVFAIDSSGSMTSNDPSNLRKSAAKYFVDRMDFSRDTAGVVSWDSRVNFAQPLTSSIESVKTSIDTVDSSGGTDLNAGLNGAIGVLDANTRTGDSAKVIIFLTDGQGTYTSATAQAAAQKGYKIYSIGLSSSADATPLRDMANQTGGQYYSSPDAANLQAIYNDIFKQVVASTIPQNVDVVETTQEYILVDNSSFNIAPESVVTDSSGITTITWKNIGMGDGSPDLKADEKIVLSFNAKSDKAGDNLGVDVLGTAKVNYQDSEGNDAGSVDIPQAYINVKDKNNSNVSNNPPVANAGPDQTTSQTSSSGTEVTLDGSGSTDDGQISPLTYTWTWTGGSATGVSPKVTLPTGTTTVTLTVDDGEFSSTDTVNINITEAENNSNNPPVANAGPDQTVNQTSSPGAEVTLDGSGSADDGQISPLTYTWTWTGGTAAGVSPKVTLPTGTTTVTLTVDDGEFSSTDTVNINVTTLCIPKPKLPVAAFCASPTSGNAPLKVKFTDKSTNSPTSWNWNFGDGTYSTEKNPIHTYSKAGKYSIVLTVKNAAGSNKATRSGYITVAASLKAPVAAFYASPRSGKAPLKVQFTDKSTNSPSSWKWSFGDGTYSTQKNPSHIYSKAGKYNVSLTVKNAKGSNTKTVSGYIVVAKK